MSDDNGGYWAAEVDSETLVSRFFDEARRSYLRRMKMSGRYGRVVRAFNTYRGYGTDGGGDTSSMGTAGDRGELIDVTTNDFAQLVQQGHVLLTQAPPAFKAIAANTDYRSRLSAELGDVLCEYYESEGSMSEAEVECGKAALLSSEAFVVLSWNKRVGREISADVEAGEVIREGDAEFRMVPSWDSCYDLTCGTPQAQQWFAYRVPVNRWDLAATHPKCTEALASSEHEQGDEWEFPWRKRSSELPRSDFVWMWELRHLRTPALASGRLVRFVSPTCVLFDSVQAGGYPSQHLEMYPPQDGAEGKGIADYGYPYGAELEAIPLVPERIVGEMEPHTSYFDLLSLQDGIDAAMSAMASAANAGGASNWQVAPGSNVETTDLGGGLKLIETLAEIKLIPAAKVDEGAVRFGEICLEFMRRRVGFNDASLGDVTKGMPAQMAALLQAQAVQFHSQLQRGYYVLQAKVRTGLLRLLRRFANTKRVAAIAGKSRTYQLREFQSSDLEGIERVTFQPLNPIMRTQAGREAYADKLLAGGHVTPRQYDTLVTTGRLDAMLESESANLDRLQRDKEILREGRGLPPVQMVGEDPALTEDGEPRLGGGEQGKQYIRPLVTDTHWIDIPELLAVIALPDVRQDAAVVKATLEVIDMKLQMLREQDPLLMALLGGPVEMVMQFKAGGMPMAGGPPQPGAMPSPNQPPNASPAGKTAVPAGGPAIKNVSQPKPPPNPLTGEKPPSPFA